MAQVKLSHVNLCDADLSSADLNGASFDNVNLCGANLRYANLNSAHLSQTNFQGVDLTGADLTEANLLGADLTSTNLSKADLRRAQLSGTHINDIDYAKLDSMNGEDGIYHEEANLSHSILKEANLRGVNLSRVDLHHANLQGADLSETNLRDTNLRGANLINASLVRTKLSSAKLSGSFIYGISAWDIQLDNTKQLNLIVTPPDQATITVDNLEVAQFIYLLLNHKKLRDVLNSVMERGILLLGRFTDGGLEVLQAIAAKLRDMKYLPIIFDFPRPDSRNLTETVMTLVGLSRFVIVDLSGRSVANELRSTVPHFKVPFVPIIEESRKQDIYSMFSDFLEDDWVLPLVVFTSKEQLMELLPLRIIKPAEESFSSLMLINR